MMTTQERLSALANLLGVPVDRLKTSTDNPLAHQVDVYIEAPHGRFRVGYFDGHTFFRENPIPRTLWRYGVAVSEGIVGKDSEPQYDMVFRFNADGKLVYVSDQRTSMEAQF